MEYELIDNVKLTAVSDICAYGTDDYIVTFESDTSKYRGFRIPKKVFENYFREVV